MDKKILYKKEMRYDRNFKFEFPNVSLDMLGISGENSFKAEFIYNDETTICILYLNEKHFKGVVKLYEPDEYDKYRGEQLAYEKAREKLNKHLINSEYRIIAEITTFFNSLAESIPEKLKIKKKLKNCGDQK